MRIEHLAEFVDLARTLSYTQTAQNMLVSESALSRHIRGLEDELGVVLFERISRRVRLSSHGQLLLEYAEPMRQSWSAYRTELSRVKSRGRAAVTIATNYYVADVIAEFLAAHPDVAVRQVSQGEPNEVVLDMLAARSASWRSSSTPASSTHTSNRP